MANLFRVKKYIQLFEKSIARYNLFLTEKEFSNIIHHTNCHVNPQYIGKNNNINVQIA